MKDSDGIWALNAAAEAGLNDVVQKLVEAGADINSLCGPSNWTPIHYAYKNPSTVALLIKLGADLCIGDVDGDTVLDLALYYGHGETAKTILENSSANFDFTLPRTQRGFVGAVEEGCTEAVEAMLEAGADVNTIDLDFHSEPLISTAMRLSEDATLRKLLEFRPDLTLASDEQNLALHCIRKDTPLSSVRLVVNAGAKLDVLNKDREHPLSFAADYRNNEVFKYLLSKKASQAIIHTTPRDTMGTVLHIACLGGQLEMIELLLKQKMDINLSCNWKWGTPLMSALAASNDGDLPEKKVVVEFLLNNGANLHATGGLFGSPILAACLFAQSDTVALLLEQGVAVNVKDGFDRKVTHMASCNSLEVLKLLSLEDSEFSAKDVLGRVPLHYAACSGQTDLVEEVLGRSLRAGISINVEDNDGWTPLLWAARGSSTYNAPHKGNSSDSDVVPLLLERGADPHRRGIGFTTPYSASQIAYYHKADKYVQTSRVFCISC